MLKSFGTSLSWNRLTRSTLLAAALAALHGCATGPISMSAEGRAALTSAPAVYVVRYVSIAMNVMTPKSVVGGGLLASATKSSEMPSGDELERAFKLPLAADELSDQLVHKLRAEGRLTSLRVEPARLPLPWNEDVAHYRGKYMGALVLEIQASHGANYQAMNWQTYNFGMYGQARLIRVADGKVLWKKNCNAGGEGLTLDVTEFEANSGARLKQLIRDSGDRCSRVLADSLLGRTP